MTYRIVLLLCSFFFFSAVHAETAAPLPATQAFAFSAETDSSQHLVLEWKIAPGYFLYRDKLKVTALPPAVGRFRDLAWPASQTKVDPEGGTYRAYGGLLRIKLPLESKTHEPLVLTVEYQGCSQAGFCYAPVKKHLQLHYPFAGEGLKNAPLLTLSEVPYAPKAKVKAKPTGAAELAPSLFSKPGALLQDQSAAQAFLGGHGFWMTILCFLGLGLLLAFTPCSLPMIPILSSIIVGRDNLTTRKALYLSFMYVLGMSLTYAAAGMFIAWVGSGIQAYFQNVWLIASFSTLFALLAFSMLGLFTLRLPKSLQQKLSGWQAQQKGGNALGVFLMGALATLVVSPCVTAPLVGVLAYITETGNLVLGGSALFALGFGMGLPLLLVGFSAGRYLPKAGPWMDIITTIFAFILLGMAVWMLSRILAPEVILFLWASLLIAAAMYFLFFMEEFSSFSRSFSYLAGTLFIVYGFALFVGIAIGQTSPLYPLEKLALKAKLIRAPYESSVQDLAFVTVKDMAHLDALLAAAREAKIPVMLDFYAEWCESCKTVEKVVLSESAVQATLNHFKLIRANVTDNNDFDQALLKRYHVIAPPTFVFIDREGQELKEKRIVGEVDHQLFLERATTI